MSETQNYRKYDWFNSPPVIQMFANIENFFRLKKLSKFEILEIDPENTIPEDYFSFDIGYGLTLFIRKDLMRFDTKTSLHEESISDLANAIANKFKSTHYAQLHEGGLPFKIPEKLLSSELEFVVYLNDDETVGYIKPL